MGRTKKNIQLKTPEKPRKIKGFRSGSYRIATTISSRSRYDHFEISPHKHTGTRPGIWLSKNHAPFRILADVLLCHKARRIASPFCFFLQREILPPQSAPPAALFGRFSGSNAVFPPLFCKNIQTSSKEYANHRINLAFNFRGLYNESHLKRVFFIGFRPEKRLETGAFESSLLHLGAGSGSGRRCRRSAAWVGQI